MIMLLGPVVRFNLLQVMLLVRTKILAVSGVVRDNGADFYNNHVYMSKDDAYFCQCAHILGITKDKVYMHKCTEIDIINCAPRVTVTKISLMNLC